MNKAFQYLGMYLQYMQIIGVAAAFLLPVIIEQEIAVEAAQAPKTRINIQWTGIEKKKPC